MNERGNQPRHESQQELERYDYEVLVPDDAYVPTARVMGALAAAEAAGMWLGKHPAKSIGAAPPEDEGRPRHDTITEQEELEALLAEVQALTPKGDVRLAA